MLGGNASEIQTSHSGRANSRMQNLNQEKKIYHGYIRILVSVIVGFFLFFFGVYAGTHSSIVQKITKNLPFLEYSSAQAETQISATDSDMSRFWYVWNLLDQKYPFKEKVPTTQEKIYGAIAGLTASYNDLGLGGNINSVTV